MYISKLSPAQKAWFIVSLATVLFIILIGVFMEPVGDNQVETRFTVDMTIRQIVPKLEVTGKALARDLGLPMDTPKNKTLASLGISQEELDHAIEHLLSHRSTLLKYYVYAAIALFGLVYLTRLGRPEMSTIKERKSWFPRLPYTVALLVAVIACGFFLGKSPNPMEGVVKVFKAMVGLYPSVFDKVASFGFLIVLVIIGNKLVCGWACPFGALEELLYSLPVLKKIKRKKLPFRVTNTIRGGLFILTLLILFGVIGGRKGFVIYHYINPFNLFNLDFDVWLIPVTIITALALSLFVYRPFCFFICPFGFISWLVERLSLARVLVDRDLCTDCGACIQACPSEAARGKVEGKIFAADCFSCARCLNKCPEDAIRYGCVFTDVTSPR